MAHDDPEIKRLRARFVCVRLTRMNGVDLRRFEFDYDTTWAAFFLDQQLNVYSRYGGRDENKPEGRMCKESLLQTMREVLETHDHRSESANKFDLPIVQLPTKTFESPERIPLLSASHEGCVHCHQVREYRMLQSYHDGNFQRKMLFPYPLPKNIGMTVDEKHGHRIEKTAPDSAAAKAGLQAGDVVVGINNVPVHSEFDIRWGLHHAPDNRQVVVTVLRRGAAGNQKPLRVPIALPADWRETDISWRKSMRSVPFPLATRGYALTRSQRKDEGFREDQLAIRIISVRGPGLGSNLGLNKRDIVVAIEKSARHRTFDEFRSDLLRRYKPGDTVRITILRDGNRVNVAATFPDWFTAENAVP